MNKKEYEYQQGRQFGSASTLDQKRGAQDAAYEVDKMNTANAFDGLTKNQPQWSNHQPSLPERTPHIQQPPRRIEPSRPTQSTGKPMQSPISTANDDWSTGWGIIGFIIAAVWATNQMQDTSDAAFPVIVAGIFGALILGRFYKAIIGLAIIAIVLVIFAGGK
ncbi:hypothetical protein [Nitrosomonas ureae]|uniref:Uncharacterized protein n=1 Tax=Nitrosomonas ureae TaxID=44577 RepID=A0A1H9FIE9_9PROT|nr:hypothetical protein [Nitrosomonas ureae]SEQ37273.1 hypothetical protein SAMN05421510_104315 [Nitrosomonas ureae]